MKKKWTLAIAAALTVALTACANSAQSHAPEYVGMDAAKNTALTDAGVVMDSAVFRTAKLEEENGTAYYELKFSDGTTEYDYDVDALTGVIIESKKEVADSSSVASQQPSAVNFSVASDETQAKDIALTDAGVMETDASYLVVKPDTDDGVAVYDVEFYVPATNTEYDYEIDAQSGAIRSKDQDIEGYTPNSSTASAANGAAGNAVSSTANSAAASSSTAVSTTSIDESRAKEIALTDARVAESSTSYLVVKQDYDDGVKVYDVEFYANGTEYDYEIDAQTGNIRSVDHDAEGYTAPQTGSAKSEAEIQSIALAKVPGATSQHIRMNMDFDDGRQTYEGKIVYNNMEYEFTIDAYSGAILEWESESIYD